MKRSKIEVEKTKIYSRLIIGNKTWVVSLDFPRLLRWMSLTREETEEGLDEHPWWDMASLKVVEQDLNLVRGVQWRWSMRAGCGGPWWDMSGRDILDM